MSTKAKLSIFGSTARDSILTLLFLNTSQRYYLREISGRVGMSAGAIQRELKNLIRLDLITSEKSGNRVYYSLNRKNPIFKDLENIIKKQGGFINDLTSILKKLSGIEAAFIYGSFAKNTDIKASDVDLFVIGGVSSAELALSLRLLEKKISREINSYIISGEELRAKLKSENHFLRTVLFKDKKMMVIGSEDEIQTIIGQ
jgi:predicted nucleotidyltransferase